MKVELNIVRDDQRINIVRYSRVEQVDGAGRKVDGDARLRELIDLAVGDAERAANIEEDSA